MRATGSEGKKSLNEKYRCRTLADSPLVLWEEGACFFVLLPIRGIWADSVPVNHASPPPPGVTYIVHHWAGGVVTTGSLNQLFNA